MAMSSLQRAGGKLARHFIASSLYASDSGYFAKRDIIKDLHEGLPFNEMLGMADYHKGVQKAYDSKPQAWLTPVEVFRPHYSAAMAKYMVEEARRAGLGRNGKRKRKLRHKTSGFALLTSGSGSGSSRGGAAAARQIGSGGTAEETFNDSHSQGQGQGQGQGHQGEAYDTGAPWDELVIYEVGGGSGTNALCILDWMQQHAPDEYERTTYTIIEISSLLAERQRERVCSRHRNCRVLLQDALSWVEDGWPTEQRPCFFLGMEVLDNLPHDKVAWRRPDVNFHSSSSSRSSSSSSNSSSSNSSSSSDSLGSTGGSQEEQLCEAIVEEWEPPKLQTWSWRTPADYDGSRRDASATNRRRRGAGGGAADPLYIEKFRPVSDPTIQATLAAHPAARGFVDTQSKMGGGGGQQEGVPAIEGAAAAAAAAAAGGGGGLSSWWRGLMASRRRQAEPSACFIPTGAFLLLNSLSKAFPRHRVILADFDYLPPPVLDRPIDSTMEALQAPLVSARDPITGESYDYNTYLVPQGKADIMFATDFEALKEMYSVVCRRPSSAVHVTKQHTFLKAFANVHATTCRNGYNPLLEDFSNTKMLFS